LHFVFVEISQNCENGNLVTLLCKVKGVKTRQDDITYLVGS
jgi:hypothetical protein